MKQEVRECAVKTRFLKVVSGDFNMRDYSFKVRGCGNCRFCKHEKILKRIAKGHFKPRVKKHDSVTSN